MLNYHKHITRAMVERALNHTHDLVTRFNAYVLPYPIEHYRAKELAFQELLDGKWDEKVKE